MEEIAKNDYNLNISRYVSTSTSQEIIELEQVHINLVEIEKKATEARNRHNGFLKELGLQPI